MIDDLTVLILTGGHSRRFDDDKAFLKVGGNTLIGRVVERFEKAQRLIISCKKGKRKLRKMFPEAEVVGDEHREEGPLIGLLSALPLVETKYVAVLPCDHPHMKVQVLNFLLERAEGHEAAVPRWPNGYLEPLVAVYDAVKLKEAARRVWSRGLMKLSLVIDELTDVVFVPMEEIREVDPELESFVNINSPDDLESIVP